MPVWKRTSKWKQARVKLIIARDGMLCWLCNRHLLKGGKSKNRRITLEHLTPRALGGSDELENLALCHPGCNRHLADRTLTKKLKIRTKKHRDTELMLEGLAKP